MTLTIAAPRHTDPPRVSARDQELIDRHVDPRENAARMAADAALDALPVHDLAARERVWRATYADLLGTVPPDAPPVDALTSTPGPARRPVTPADEWAAIAEANRDPFATDPAAWSQRFDVALSHLLARPAR